MLHLLILRHAEAAPPASGGDFERPLTATGQRDAVRMGRVLRDTGIAVTKTLVSPSRRTLETLSKTEEGFGAPLAAEFAEPLYNAGLETLRDIVAAQPADVASLLIVGHNPSLSEAASFYASAGPPALLAEMRQHFPAPCLTVIAFDVLTWGEVAMRSGRLVAFKT